MRVTMYTHDYEPIFVLSVNEGDLDILRRYRGDYVVCRLPEPQAYRLGAPNDPVGRVREIRAQIIVEGMEWADRRTRYILVAHGLHSREIEGERADRIATEMYHHALAAARRYTGSAPANIAQGRNTTRASDLARIYSPVSAPDRMVAQMDIIRRELQRQAPDMVGVQVRQEGERFMAEAVRPGDRINRFLNAAASWPYPVPTGEAATAAAAADTRTNAQITAEPDPLADL